MSFHAPVPNMIKNVNEMMVNMPPQIDPIESFYSLSSPTPFLVTNRFMGILK